MSKPLSPTPKSKFSWVKNKFRFAQDKLKKQLRARQRKKEKIRTLKFGLADGKSAAKHKKLKTE
jgi:hypothetical protein